MGILLLSHIAIAEQLNIYVGYHDAVLAQNINHLNQFLERHHLFEKYDIEPFITRYPLHTTLYLSEFPSESHAQLIQKLEKITETWQPFVIETSYLEVTKGNYVMWQVKHEPQDNGLNPTMQDYSDKMVMALHRLRDTHAPIPDWAQSMPSKRAAFIRYGSPNVFFELSPHFTLMAKKFQSPDKAKAFQQEVTILIEQYQKLTPIKPIKLKASHIGIGYVDNFGQVTREIMRFPLTN